MKKHIPIVIVMILCIVVVGLNIVYNNQQIQLKEELVFKTSQLEKNQEENLAIQEQLNKQQDRNTILQSELDTLSDSEVDYQARIDALLSESRTKADKQFSYEDNVEFLESLNKPFVNGRLNDMDVVLLGRKWTGTDLEEDPFDTSPMTMVKEAGNNVLIYQVFQGNIKFYQLNKQSFIVEKELTIKFSGNNSGNKPFAPTIKSIDDELFVLLNNRIEIYDLNLELLQVMELPEFMYDYFGTTNTKGLDGRESILRYDISDDLETLVYSDSEGLKLYNRLAKTTKLLLSPPQDIVDGGYHYYYLHPRFHGDKIVTQVYTGYIGFYKFYIYDLKLDSVVEYETSPSDYGYIDSIGEYFSIYGDGHNFVLYDYIEDQIKEIDYTIVDMESYRYTYKDGLKATVYSLTKPRSNEDVWTSHLLYFDYDTQDFMNKSLDFICDKHIQVIAVLEDKTAIILYSTDDGDYLVRF